MANGMESLASVNYDRLPNHMQIGARRYVEQGVKPGDFTMAILTNDLYMAIRQADRVNMVHLEEWMDWRDMLPPAAHGSAKKVAAWISRRGLQGTRGGFSNRRNYKEVIDGTKRR